MSRARNQCQRGKQGIALVIVLGMLATLVLMGVAFSISMRTERLAAAAYVDVIRARHLVDVAIAEVLTQELEDALAGAYYPDWDAYTSGSDGSSGIDFLETVNENFVPPALEAAARAEGPINWQNILDPLDPTILHGQYAYMAINVSGMLDANAVAATNRAYGEIPGEMQMDVDGAAFAANDAMRQLRDNIVRFENVPELRSLYTTRTFPGADRPESEIAHFHVYSRYPQGYAADGGEGPLTAFPQGMIGGDPSGWNEAAILDALTRQPFLFDSAPALNTELATMFLDQMVDFASETYVPRNVEAPTAKRVPMINEVIVTPEVELTSNPPGGNQFTLRITVDVETWYPWSARPLDPGLPFAVAMNGAPTLTRVRPAAFAGLQSALALVSGPDPASFQGNPSNPYLVSTFVFEATIPSPPPAALRALAVEMALPQMDVTGAGTPVDRVLATWAANAFQFGFRMGGIAPDGPAVAGIPAARAYSANDPRLNEDPGTAVTAGPQSQWQSSTATPDAPNATLNGPAEEVEYMYTRQGPFYNPAEVSYLLFDDTVPWRTVPLLGTVAGRDVHLIPGRLTTLGETNSTVAGKVNINTSSINALASAFRGAPSQRAAGTINDSLSDSRAVELAELIEGRIDALPEGGLRQVAELAEHLSIGDLSGLLTSPPDEGTKFYYESPIRTSYNLLGTRHNLFSIFLAVRVFPRGFDASTPAAELDASAMAEQRAVLTVWRDPFVTGTGATSANETFLRSFSWLTMRDF
jgi:hypothetical protein